jgi:glucosyl-dolichyl phosphate glucuronosyltransferase
MMSVILSSHNGGAVLTKTLQSMARVKEPGGGWKLIAVDNASTDQTADILRAYRESLPLTILDEPVPGKNRSLNRALELAEGDFYIFCDDDVIVAQDWLIKWREAANQHEDYSLFAGSTAPYWPSDPPQWNLQTTGISIAFGTNEHMHEGPCDARCMLGTNMAIRASVFKTGIKFNANIGPDSSRTYPMGSETELARRLAGLQYQCWFAEGPRVKHIVRPNQMKLPAILMRGYRWGRGQAHMQEAHHYSPRLLGWKNYLRWSLYPLLMLFYGQDEAWARQWEWVTDQGYEDGWRECRNRAPRWSRRGPHIVSRFRR